MTTPNQIANPKTTTTMRIYNVHKHYDGEHVAYVEAESLDYEEAIATIEREAKHIADHSDAIAKEWIADMEDLEALIADNKAQGASEWVARYEEIKKGFTPGLWKVDLREDAELLYAKGSDILRYDNWAMYVEDFDNEELKEFFSDFAGCEDYAVVFNGGLAYVNDDEIRENIVEFIKNAETIEILEEEAVREDYADMVEEMENGCIILAINNGNEIMTLAYYE